MYHYYWSQPKCVNPLLLFPIELRLLSQDPLMSAEQLTPQLILAGNSASLTAVKNVEACAVWALPSDLVELNNYKYQTVTHYKHDTKC